MLLTGGVVACGSAAPEPAPVPPSGSISLSPTADVTATVDHPPPPQTPGPGRKFYVSLGDSYAAGWQPADTDTSSKVTVSSGGTNTNGFAYQLAGRTIRGTRLTLVNYGCSGATVTGMIDEPACLPLLLGPGAPLYPTQSQADAAIDFIRRHRDQVAFVTVIIGANDVTRCIGVTDLASCLKEPLQTVQEKLDRFLPRLRAAAGPATPIVGLTYPDVILGGYVSRTDDGKTYAARAAAGFRDHINPVLARAYARIGAAFVDVTAATGAYIPYTETVELPPFGRVPKAVAQGCTLTYYCQLMDLHPRTAGYTLMADLVQQALER